MFSRRDSQKPSDEFYASFKANWQAGALVTTTAPQSSSIEMLASAGPHVNSAIDARSYGDVDDTKDLDATPKSHMDEWKFNLQFAEHTSSAFAGLYNPFHGVYTPTPGGTALYHSQAAGDLHASSVGFGLGTPLSHSSPGGGIFTHDHSGSHLNDAQMLALSPRHFQQSANVFAGQHGFPPSHFSHHMPSFDPGHHSQESSPVQQMSVNLSSNEPSTTYTHDPNLDLAMNQALLHHASDQFRFRVSLSAPTAMIKTPDEIPITYLNKGQAYSLSITDTTPQQMGTVPTKYRTFVRISFEDEQQRVRPGSCWQLWKEGRGMNEAHHRGGKLQAVEYVDTNQGDPHARPLGPQVECESFDGFSVIWYSNQNGSAECSLAVRFNFLSTDFSHSKGVKGIPVRLCAKTEILQISKSVSPDPPLQELCYCKVKLFRDHGAERKLSNDIAHVKKTIDKLKQQIAQVEAGVKDIGKRKRSSSAAGLANIRPTKIQKSKRSGSTSSESSGGIQLSPEEDMHMRLASLQAMFTSTRPISILFLQGEEQDDPDLHPVSLQGQPPSLKTGSSHESGRKSSHTIETSSILSPSPSQRSTNSQDRREPNLKFPTPAHALSRVPSDDWPPTKRPSTLEAQSSNPAQHSFSLDQPIKVQISPATGRDARSESIQVLHLDPSYEAPAERSSKPIACFYIKPTGQGKSEDSYYRAVYLMRRTLAEFTTCVATKLDIEPKSITNTIWINQKGLSIKVDDEVIRELAEGQDMIVECTERQMQDSYTHFLDDEAGDDSERSNYYTSSGMELVLKF